MRLQVLKRMITMYKIRVLDILHSSAATFKSIRELIREAIRYTYFVREWTVIPTEHIKWDQPDCLHCELDRSLVVTLVHHMNSGGKALVGLPLEDKEVVAHVDDGMEGVETILSIHGKRIVRP